jgi:hypothetical protein
VADRYVSDDSLWLFRYNRHTSIRPNALGIVCAPIQANFAVDTCLSDIVNMSPYHSFFPCSFCTRLRRGLHTLFSLALPDVLGGILQV